MVIGILNIKFFNNQIQESSVIRNVYNGAFESIIEIWKLVPTYHNFSHLRFAIFNILGVCKHTFWKLQDFSICSCVIDVFMFYDSTLQ
jgi:hypothetical protein